MTNKNKEALEALDELYSWCWNDDMDMSHVIEAQEAIYKILTNAPEEVSVDELTALYNNSDLDFEDMMIKFSKEHPNGIIIKQEQKTP